MSTESVELTTRRYKGRGLEIAVDEAGPKDGPVVILLHGGGQTRHAWGGALRQGARLGFRMISADLRGHGESGWAADLDYSIDASVADLRAMIDDIGQTPFIVGASLGGLIGLIYAGEGGPVRGLVLVDVAPRIELNGAARIGAFMRSAPNGFASVDEAADAVAAYLPHRPRPKDTSGLMKNLRLRDDGRYHWHWDPQMFDGRDLRDPERLHRAARALTAPVLLVRGGLSDVVSPEGAKEFLALAPHAEFVDIAGADHMVAGDRNDAFNAATFDFLQRQAGKHAETA
jgi:pimeloyl-ACP methyl ester carboxylesterase